MQKISNECQPGTEENDLYQVVASARSQSNCLLALLIVKVHCWRSPSALRARTRRAVPYDFHKTGGVSPRSNAVLHETTVRWQVLSKAEYKLEKCRPCRPKPEVALSDPFPSVPSCTSGSIAFGSSSIAWCWKRWLEMRHGRSIDKPTNQDQLHLQMVAGNHSLGS